MSPLLETTGLSPSLGGHRILDGIDLAVALGELHVLLGANGAGKSSLAYCLMGCAGYRPGAGNIRFGGEDIGDAPVHEWARRGLALAWQEPARFEGLSVRDYLAIGAHIAKRAYIPAKDSARILDAVSVLRSMEGAEQPMLGRRVVVYGGGNTAIDVARTARRLGATDAIIVYRRTRDRMPAHDFELEEALEEGVKVKWLSTITGAVGETLTIEKMTLDADGKPQPTGEFETLDADSLVLALGQDVDMSLLQGVEGLLAEDGVVQVDPVTQMTGHPGLFAGGDMAPGARNVTVAIGQAKKAAGHIDAWLRGQTVAPKAEKDVAAFEKLNTWYYSDAPKTVRPQLDIARRTSSFDEVQGGLTEDTALFEARRCLSCGNCFECDNCYGVCPDNAVIKLGPGKRFEINLDYCKGCGICAAECPCGAIKMTPEEV